MLKRIKQKWELSKWEKLGRPFPPPHLIKQRTIKDFANKYKLKVFIESGTCYGDMVEAMKNHFSQIYSIELSNDLYIAAKGRFSAYDNIKILHGDSGIEIGNLLSSLDQPALFWLDGHYSGGITAKGDKDTPIFEELNHIFSHHENGHVVIIDDARCFGTDPAYPSIEEIANFLKEKSPNYIIDVKNDSIRITPH